MAPPIISLRDISLSWGADPILDGLEMHIGMTDRLCLLGRNGTGKSTLMKIIAGITEADGGERWVQPGMKIAYLPQEPDASNYKTLRDYVMGVLPVDEQDQTYRADVLLADLQADGMINPSSASGGELRRAALARTLISEPDLLLLDEPTNHLDIHIIEWLENYLKRWRGALMIISHDRAFLANLTTACLWLDRSVVRRFDGGFDKFEAWQEHVLADERTQARKLNKLIKQETRWSVEGISARRTRNQGRLRRLHDLRAQRASKIQAKGLVNLTAAEGSSSGKRVIDAIGISKTYAGRTLFAGLDIKINRGDRVGIIGPNGVGKSTLLKILTGETPSDTGSLKIGTKLDTLVIDQKRSSLKDTMTIRDALTGRGGDQLHVNGEPKHIMSYMKDFLFEPSQVDTPVSALSGGERNRLLLAANFAKPSNLMILDEPTNDLDMETLDLLQDVMGDYDGTIILVSHDRDFLDRIVTSSIVMEGDGTATEYAGGYSDYLAQKKASAPKGAPDSVVPSSNVIGMKTTQVANAPKQKANKLSYKDKRALDQLPAEIEALSMRISELEATLSDPTLYTDNPDKFQAVSDHLALAQGQLSEKETRWLDLEELKEQLES